MITKKLLLPVFYSLLCFALTFYSCSTTSDTVSPSGASYPTFNLTAGSFYKYTIDTLPPGGGSFRTNDNSTRTILDQGTYFNFTDVFRTLIVDSVGLISIRDTSYSRYDSTTGKAYIYGFNDLTQSLDWDLIADFSIPFNTPWLIDSVSFPFPIPQGIVPMNGSITGRIIGETTIQTTGNPPETLQCYRIEFKFTAQGTIIISSVTYTFTLTATMDYYLGYSSSQYPGNPSGLLRLTENPGVLSSNPHLYSDTTRGKDYILETYTIAD